MESSLQQLKGLLQALPRGLQDHLERVRESARALATIHSVPLEAVELAALGHDLARACSAETLLKQAREYCPEIPQAISNGDKPLPEQLRDLPSVVVRLVPKGMAATLRTVRCARSAILRAYQLAERPGVESQPMAR